MSPGERFRNFSEKTRVSLPVAMLGSLLVFGFGAAAAAYSIRDQAVTEIRAEIRLTAADVRRERDETLRSYMTREEFWKSIEPKLERMSAKLDALREQR